MIKRRPSTQQCPICRALQPIEATRCTHCGAALLGVPVSATQISSPTQTRLKQTDPLPPSPGNWDDGETDLHEGSLPAFPLAGLLVLLVTLGIISGTVFLLMRRGDSQPVSTAPTETATEPISEPTSLPLPGTVIAGLATSNTPTPPRATMPPTNTRIAPPTLTPSITALVEIPSITALPLPTVTPIPPSPTITPTRGPCMQKAKAGDTLGALAARCGQYGQAVIQIILETNNMTSPAQLQVGQIVEIPWPTPTGAPAGNTRAAGTPNGVEAANVEPTLPAGVMWHVVKKGENAIIIAAKYNATIKILHDLNPEISQSFSQCDYGLPAGGKDCTVNLSENQRIRVPAPTPTATLSPTLTGSETATPTATATFNAPNSDRPEDNWLYSPTDLPVLSWTASGTLGAGQVYLITVKDLTINRLYVVSTKDTSFQVPPEWQPTDGKRHEFSWSVSVAQLNSSGTPVPTAYTTETRTFTWQGP